MEIAKTIIFRDRRVTTESTGTEQSILSICSKKIWKLANWKWINFESTKVSMRNRAWEIELVNWTVGLMTEKWASGSSISLTELSLKENRPPKTWAEIKLTWTSVTKANQNVCGWHHWKPNIPAKESLWKNGVPPVTRNTQKSGESDRKSSPLAIVKELGNDRIKFFVPVLLCSFSAAFSSCVLTHDIGGQRPSRRVYRDEGEKISIVQLEKLGWWIGHVFLPF